jgi:hypothetical protein
MCGARTADADRNAGSARPLHAAFRTICVVVGVQLPSRHGVGILAAHEAVDLVYTWRICGQIVSGIHYR